MSILLNALDKAGKSIHYYALDLSKRELERTLSSVPKFEHVVCHGLLGTYDDGLEWIRSGCNASWPKCIMSLGSSIGAYASIFKLSFINVGRELPSRRGGRVSQGICGYAQTKRFDDYWAGCV